MMIRIQEHLGRTDVEVYLDSLAEILWAELNPKLKTKKGHKVNSLIEKCKKNKAQTSSKDYIKNYALNDIRVAKRHKDFFSFLLKNNAKELKNIIVSRPNQFSLIKTKIYTILKQDDIYIGTPDNYSQTAFGKLLSDSIFNYTAFRRSDFCKKLFADIGFNNTTCPYCNDNKLNIVDLNKGSSLATKLKAYLDLDHFYSKSQHPFFAVSFFNLIPTCHDCNSGDKGDKLFTVDTHIHPYYESFDDYYTFKISLMVLLGDPIDSITIERSAIKPLDQTLTDLNLELRYSNNFVRANELVDLFWKNKKHIGTEFENDFKKLLMRDIPVLKNDILKHQRAKMNRDILKQIDITKVLNIR